MRQAEPPSRCLQIRQPLLSDGAYPCGLPFNPLHSLRLSTAEPEHKSCGTTWKAKSTTDQQISRPRSILKTDSAPCQALPVRQRNVREHKKVKDRPSGLSLYLPARRLHNSQMRRLSAFTATCHRFGSLVWIGENILH